MSPMTYPEAKDFPTKAYARASSQGIWLGRDHEGGLTTTKDFSLALPCDSKEQALELWDELCSWASGSADGKPAPKWSLSKPAIFMGVDHAKAPSSLSAFLAMCQGRFVTLEETPGGRATRSPQHRRGGDLLQAGIGHESA